MREIEGVWLWETRSCDAQTSICVVKSVYVLPFIYGTRCVNIQGPVLHKVSSLSTLICISNI